MGYYVLQSKPHTWGSKWITWGDRRFSSLEEAQAALDALPFRDGYRIAEAYTVTRYKPVKGVRRQ